MRFVSVREIRLKPARVWQRLKEEHELVVTSNGRPMGVLTDAKEADLEATLRALRQAKAEVAVAQIREDARRRGLDTLDLAAINQRIRSIRRSRKR